MHGLLQRIEREQARRGPDGRRDTGSIDLPPGVGGFASLISFTGGTGQLAGASGQIRLRGEFSPVEGTTTGDYLGSLCR